MDYMLEEKEEYVSPYIKSLFYRLENLEEEIKEKDAYINLLEEINCEESLDYNLLNDKIKDMKDEINSLEMEKYDIANELLAETYFC